MSCLGVKTVTPFDFVNSINFTKKDLMPDEVHEKQYVPFIVNRALSYFMDTVYYANEMNLCSTLDSKLQYHYLINSVRPQKRFSKWVKKQEDSDLDAVMEYFGYSYAKARTAIELLSPEQIKIIKQKLEKGGDQ